MSEIHNVAVKVESNSIIVKCHNYIHDMPATRKHMICISGLFISQILVSFATVGIIFHIASGLPVVFIYMQDFLDRI